MGLGKCPRCGFDDRIEKNVDEVLRGGDDAAVVKVLAKVCLHCGERTYTSDIFYRFGAIRKMLARGEVEEFQVVGRYFRVPEDFVDTGAEDMAKFIAELSAANPPQAD